jgi:hypothetical protein
LDFSLRQRAAGPGYRGRDAKLRREYELVHDAGYLQLDFFAAKVRFQYVAE